MRAGMQSSCCISVSWHRLARGAEQAWRAEVTLALWEGSSIKCDDYGTRICVRLSCGVVVVLDVECRM